MAKVGLFAKGIVYCLIGLLAFMSAFHIGGQSASKSDKSGLVQYLLQQPLGKIALIIISAGLLCYSIWRFMQTFLDTEHKGKEPKGLGKRFSYFFSGVAYLSVSFIAIKAVLENSANSNGKSRADMVQSLLEKPWGVWVLIAQALVLSGIGIYQVWYGFSEKYKKHVDAQELDQKTSYSLLKAGKIGYIARGIVWLLIAFLLFKAITHHNASEAGDTGTAFSFVQNNPYGTYLLAILAIGLICYGVMNFIRAAFERVGR